MSICVQADKIGGRKHSQRTRPRVGRSPFLPVNPGTRQLVTFLSEKNKNVMRVQLFLTSTIISALGSLQVNYIGDFRFALKA